MAIPFFKEMRIGGYLMKQKLLGRKRYPLVLMLEPLFRCNLACVGCGKIDYPDAILNRRMSAQECWTPPMNTAQPMVATPAATAGPRAGSAGSCAAWSRAEIPCSLCTDAVAGEEATFTRTIALSVLLGASRRLKEHHDKALPGRCVRSRGFHDKAAKAKGFTVNVNA